MSIPPRTGWIDEMLRMFLDATNADGHVRCDSCECVLTPATGCYPDDRVNPDASQAPWLCGECYEHTRPYLARAHAEKRRIASISETYR